MDMTKDTKTKGGALINLIQGGGALTTARQGGLVARLTGTHALATIEPKQANPVQPSRFEGEEGKVGFVFDATASREYGWEGKKHQHIALIDQAAEMKNLRMRLVIHSGGKVYDNGWTKNFDSLRDVMRKQGTHGGETKIVDSLECFIYSSGGKLPSAVVVAGDCCEEAIWSIKTVAAKLKAAGVRVFTFQEGPNMYAGNVFRILAEDTGGAFAEFGSKIDFVEFCKSVQAFAVGGREELLTLAMRGDKTARKLANQIPAQQIGMDNPAPKPA